MRSGTALCVGHWEKSSSGLKQRMDCTFFDFLLNQWLIMSKTVLTLPISPATCAGLAKPNVKSNRNICNGHGSRGESTLVIKIAHKYEMYSFCPFSNKQRCRAIQRFTHTFPWFPLDSVPSVNGFLRAVSISGTAVADSFVPCNYLPADQTLPRTLYSK